jgi:hypothetical protein
MAVALASLMALVPVTVLAAALPVTSGKLTVASKSYAAPVTCTLTAVADSYVARELAASNFGTLTSLIVSSDGTATKRALVRFDLSTCSPTVPADAIVTSAKLRLATAAIALATRTYEAIRATAAWTETGVTWTNQPAVAASPSDSTSVSLGTASGTVVEWNVIGDVQSFVTAAASDLGWRVADSVEGGVGTVLTFNAREAASSKPQLVLSYSS